MPNLDKDILIQNIKDLMKAHNVSQPKLATDIVNITLHFFLKDIQSMQHSVMNHSIVSA